MKNLKDQKGITLVALVITIIVLLILAGVSLSLVVGDNGILGRASSTAEAQRVAEAKEQTIMALVDLQSDYYDKKYDPDKTTPTETDAYTYALNNLPTKIATGVEGTKRDDSTTPVTDATIKFNNGSAEVTYKVTYDETSGQFKFTKKS